MKNQQCPLTQVEVLLLFGRILNFQQSISVSFPLCPCAFPYNLLMEASVKKSHEEVTDLCSMSHVFKKLIFFHFIFLKKESLFSFPLFLLLKLFNLFQHILSAYYIACSLFLEKKYVNSKNLLSGFISSYS